MKKLLLAPVLLLAACASGGGSQEPTMTADEFETKVASSIFFDPALLKTGDRVVYFVKRSDSRQTQTYTWSAVAEEPGAVWIENKVPFEVKWMIVKTKIDRNGPVLEQWIGEPGGKPARRYGGPRSGNADLPQPVRDTSVAKANSKEEPDRIVVGGRPYDCTRVTTSLSYPDGTKSTMVNWFSKEVPFAASKTLGGLVKRQFGKLSMEIVAGDHNGKSEMAIPAPEK